jgi:phosphonate transport system substrate-binding protein
MEGMMVRLCKCRAAVLLIGLSLLFQAWLAPPAHGAEYAFGVVPQFDHRQLFAIWKPILDELGKRTGLSFKVVLSPDIPSFEKEYLKGIYDFAYMNPYHLLKANQAVGYQPIIHDQADLFGILVVRRDSPLNNPADLNGRTIAFPSPNALGASLLMRADLSDLFHVRITPLYVKSHDSVYLHVVKGLADAGGGVMRTLTEQDDTIKEALKIIYVTRPMPSHPVASHPRVPGTDVEKIRRALLEMATTKEGLALLSKIPLNHPVPASLGDYTPMSDWGLERFWVEN